jgi:hypothetical protein
VLAAGIRLAHEENLAACLVARHQHQDALRLIDAGEVKEAAVLPVFVVDVVRVDALGRAPDDRERVGAEPFHGPGAAGAEVVLQGASRGRLNGQQQHDDKGSAAFLSHGAGIVLNSPFAARSPGFAGNDGPGWGYRAYREMRHDG